ncbi:MAG: histidine--tRNA ligase [Nitrososphaerota archaeon]
MSEPHYNPPRGMRDIVGEEAELYEHLFSEFKAAARRHGFMPIITPTVEYFTLFEAKSGEEIKRSMYVFEDKGGRLLALRPEVTASVVRAYLKSLRSLPKPIKVYYVSQCFRYEEPQHARYREFWQGGLEVIGEQDINADLLVAIAASDFLDRVGVNHLYEVGNVSIYRGFMRKLEVSGGLQDYILHLIDKDQVDAAINKLREVAGERGAEIFKSLLSTKDLDRVEGFIADYGDLLGELREIILTEHARTRGFIDTLREIGYSAEYEPKLVRGLAYYTGLIFEYKVTGTQALPSIGGGGRYDGLTEVYSGTFEYSTGLALGIDRVALALSGRPLPQTGKYVVVLILGDAPLHVGYRTLKAIVKGTNVNGYVYRARSLSRGLEHVNKAGCELAVIIGERELKGNSLIIKNMKTGEQVQVSLGSILEAVKNMISS